MNTSQRKEFANLIRPSIKGKSDKFSWRLYQRALKKGRECAYLMAWNSIYGYCKPDIKQLDGEFVPAYQLAIGIMVEGWFHGATVRQISTPGAPNHDWAFGPGHHTAEWIDVTEWFWSSYARIGRCLIWQNEHSWTRINRNSRKCDYCGKHERRQVKTVKKIERREVWS